MTVNLGVMERWASALESGDYGQTTGVLTDGKGRYCCLGVLCELAVKDGIIKKRAEQPTFDDECDDTDCCGDDGCAMEWVYGGNALLPPRAVIDWAFGTDWAGANPTLKLETPITDAYGDTFDELEASGLNDSLKLDFEAIGAAVRRTFLDSAEVKGVVNSDHVIDSSPDSGEVSELASA